MKFYAFILKAMIVKEFTREKSMAITKKDSSGKASNKAAVAPKADQEQEKDLSTLSVRFTDEQRDLLVRAAETKGWTPTGLIRAAALEKAIHIVNTSRVTKFDFKGLASEVAARLFESRTVEHYLDDEDLEQATGPANIVGPPVIDVPVPPLALDALFKLKQAARLGGSEFLNLIVEFAEGLTASQRSDLPDPVDPGKTDS